eukprot:NODE_1444_length_968_cov_345.362350_g995_i0.p1 GENE.NODE_1444_length_968_cov_345.362350_g995_i0~~NODE_1444_length_968_cov_345.362350_g995_i0.p1  ORF type:complete len:251 (-),score=29.29 NODE_1444_length_968_cov_345.362350_g995_i0:122-874(-)
MADLVLVVKGLQETRQRISEVVLKEATRPPRLVAVSKFKGADLVRAAYDAGQHVFGENYVQELLEKAAELQDAKDLRWHFIGHLQSNKAKALVQGVTQLAVVETVDSAKLADKLEAAVAEMDRPPLGVFVQINTSGEPSKSGIEPGQEVELVRHILSSCPHLMFQGLMTIGMPDYTSRPENFVCLKECRTRLVEALGLQEEAVELSIGMSGDFEAAIAMGSTNVRVGSSIFGARPPPAAAGTPDPAGASS